jgi:hypothetical protein
VIYRNSLLSQQVAWMADDTLMAEDIAVHFLRGECDLLRLARVANSTVAELEMFLTLTAGLPLEVERSAAGELLVRCDEVDESLLITGKTAEVLCSYIDCEPVRTQDRGDMTLRRQVAL